MDAISDEHVSVHELVVTSQSSPDRRILRGARLQTQNSIDIGLSVLRSHVPPGEDHVSLYVERGQWSKELTIPCEQRAYCTSSLL